MGLNTSTRTSQLLIVAAILIGAASVAVQGARVGAGHQAMRAAEALGAGSAVPALQATVAALAWYPWQEPAQYTQLAAFKSLGMWDRLAGAAAAARTWHPDQTLLYQLAGEAAWRRGDHAAAAEWFWGSLWRTPHPPQTPAQVWRMAGNEGRRAWGPEDPRVAAAAVMAAALVGRDVTMSNPAIRAAALADAAENLKTIAPLSAEVVRRFF